MMRTLAGAVAGAVVVASLAGCSGAERKQATAPLPTTTTTALATTTTTAAPETTTTTAARPRPTGVHALSAFSSCRSLLRHVKREALRVVTPYGLPYSGVARLQGGMVSDQVMMGATAGGDSTAEAGPTASMSSADGAAYSGTNVQEEGVDEPDVVKSDGRRLVAIEQNKLRVVDIAAPSPTVLGTLELPADSGGFELLMAGDRVVVFGTQWTARGDVAGPSQPSSTVWIVDLAKPSEPAVVGTMKMDGQYVSTRLVAGVVRLVVQQNPKGPVFAWPTEQAGEADALAANKAAIRRSQVQDWLPTYTIERRGKTPVTAPLAPCASVLRPKDFAGLGTVSVLTVDPADPGPANPACVLGGGSIVYASPANLYVATQKWPGMQATGGRIAPFTVDTELHQFAIPGRDPAVYTASGQVEGAVLNQFSLSEHEGHLRIATTVRKPTGETESIVHVLESKAGRLETVGRLGNLGHAGETIQSVRFIGSRGYVVTFRQTDPLYVLDLHDPRHPSARGELQMPGFSSYLHPLSESVLLGVGMGPGEQGGRGLQLSLFDVADPAHPARTANVVFENAWSDAQSDHHALLWWAPTKQLVLPVRESTTSGAMAFTIDPAAGFGAPVRLTHDGHSPNFMGPITRSMVAGSRLLTLSPAGLMTSDLSTLGERAWLGW
jgi:uncharacterized secreted protein with C-terminal beta-propeller domain